jgi:hypothetical protein
VIDAKLRKIDRMRHRLERCADATRAIPAFIGELPAYVFSNDGLADDFNLSHWKLRKRSTISRYRPLELGEDVRRMSPSLRLQTRVLFAFQNPTPLISDYIRHQFSVEGQQLRAFAQQMRLETDAHELRQIPTVLASHRDSLVARIKQCSLGGTRTGRHAHVSPADSLRHTREGSDALLSALAESKAKITSEQIDFEFEKYFYQIVGPHLFDVFAEPEADRVVAQKCALFAETTPEQFGIPMRLIEGSHRPLFQIPIDKLRQLGSCDVTPTTKLIVAFQAIEALLQELNERSGVRAGVDDFTDPLQYCCVKANIPAAISHVRFISAMTRSRLQESAFWSHFITLQLVLEHLHSIDLNTEILSSSGNIHELVSVSRARVPSTFELDDSFDSSLPLIADVFTEFPPGLVGLSDPIAVDGFKAFAVPAWWGQPRHPFSIIMVRAPDSDPVILRAASLSEGLLGVRLAASLAHPPGFELSPVHVRQGVVNATTFESLPPGLSLVPITSGNLELERDEIDLKVRFVLVDSLPGRESIEEHIEAVQEQYGLTAQDPHELLRILSERVSRCLKKLGLLSLQHPGNVIDWKVLAGLVNFQHRIRDDEKISEHLSPQLLDTLEQFTSNWESALITASFGYFQRPPPEAWQLTVILIQALHGLSITGVIDEATVREAKKVIQHVLETSAISEGIRAVLNAVI